MSSPLTERIAADYASAARTLPALPDSARRRTAIEALTTHGLPSTRDENWKYANLRALERLRFVPAATAPAAAAVSGLPAAITGFSRYVFVDGRFAPELSAAPSAITQFASLPEHAAVAIVPVSERGTDQRFALLNEAFATEQASIRVPADAQGVQLELIFVASAAGESGGSYPRIELQLQSGARAQLLERHLSAGAQGSFVNSAVQVELARGAHLVHYRLQQLSARTVVFDTLTASLAQEASYRVHAISTGAQSARSTVTVRLAGERAQLALAVVALAERQQVQDSFALVEHAARNTRTQETFRGIAAGRSRVAFNGKIVVAPNAAGTDSQQSLRGLLAGPEAEIDVRPQLEIYTDEVRCSHGATAGKLDDNMLFYLLSRGLDRDSAQRLLKWAFLEDAIATIEVPELRRQIEVSLAGVLQDEALKELL